MGKKRKRKKKMTFFIAAVLAASWCSLQISAFVPKYRDKSSKLIVNVVGNSRRDLDRGLNEVDKAATDDMMKAESTLMTLMFTPPVIDPVATFW
jgi:hypothetical protein